MRDCLGGTNVEHAPSVTLLDRGIKPGVRSASVPPQPHQRKTTGTGADRVAWNRARGPVEDPTPIVRPSVLLWGQRTKSNTAVGSRILCAERTSGRWRRSPFGPGASIAAVRFGLGWRGLLPSVAFP